ncbi:MAG TPA: winged helix-turn-helix domain-containing protein [Nitrososphaera sp.]
MKFRSRVDICADILAAAKDGAIKTRIMYSSRTAMRQLNEYLDLLIENELLVYASAERVYSTSEKGIRFLESYEEAWRTLIPKSKKLPRQEPVQVVSKGNSQTKH